MFPDFRVEMLLFLEVKGFFALMGIKILMDKLDFDITF